MKVFKAYFKILRQLYPTILVYMAIFFGLSVLFTLTSSQSSVTDFTASKANIAFFNYDNETPLIKGFRDYLKENTNIIELDDNQESIDDALFYRNVTYVIKIPANFTASFMGGEEIALEVQQVPDSTSTIYAELLVNKYLNIARLYQLGDIDETVMADKIKNDLKETTTVDIINETKQLTALESANYYYNYTNYVFLAILILVIGMIMQAFKEENIKRRNLCSPLRRERVNFELMLGNIVITMVIWLLFVIGSIILHGGAMFTSNGLLLILNSFIFIMSALSISFLIGMLVKSNEAQSALANVLSLGSSFMAGAFVPQMFLSKSVLMMSSILPSYWFIKANNLICTNTLNSTTMKTILFCMMIELIFTIVMYICTFVISKYRRHA